MILVLANLSTNLRVGDIFRHASLPIFLPPCTLSQEAARGMHQPEEISGEAAVSEVSSLEEMLQEGGPGREVGRGWGRAVALGLGVLAHMENYIEYSFENVGRIRN